MNLTESIISSFFSHLILFLLIVAASSFTSSFSGGRQNIIPIDLTMEEKDLPGSVTASAEEQPLTSGLPPVEQVSVSDQAADSSAEESKESPVPEKKAEPVVEPAKTENAEKPPAQTEGDSSMEAYYQFIMMHKKIFIQNAGARVNELLGEALKVNTRHFYGGTATVSLQFGSDGNVSEVVVDSASPELKAFLEEISWVAIPAPARYSLGFTEVQIEFSVLEGYMNFRIDPL